MRAERSQQGGACSITSSARASTVAGVSRPRASAVFRLITTSVPPTEVDAAPGSIARRGWWTCTTAGHDIVRQLPMHFPSPHRLWSADRRLHHEQVLAVLYSHTAPRAERRSRGDQAPSD